MTAFARGLEVAADGAPEPEDGLGSHRFLVGHPADTVGAEQLSFPAHGLSMSRNASNDDACRPCSFGPAGHRLHGGRDGGRVHAAANIVGSYDVGAGGQGQRVGRLGEIVAVRCFGAPSDVTEETLAR